MMPSSSYLRCQLSLHPGSQSQLAMGCANSSLEVSQESESEVYLEKMTHISADITEKIIRKNKKPIEQQKSSQCCSSEILEEPKPDFPVVNITLGQDEENLTASAHSSIDMP